MTAPAPAARRHPTHTDYAGKHVARWCWMCSNTGSRIAPDAAGMLEWQPCRCQLGLCSRVLAGLKNLDTKPASAGARPPAAPMDATALQIERIRAGMAALGISSPGRRTNP